MTLKDIAFIVGISFMFICTICSWIGAIKFNPHNSERFSGPKAITTATSILIILYILYLFF